jgi:hypothetical protein
VPILPADARPENRAPARSRCFDFLLREAEAGDIEGSTKMSVTRKSGIRFSDKVTLH